VYLTTADMPSEHRSGAAQIEIDNLPNSRPDRYTGSDDAAHTRPGHIVEIVGQPAIVPVTFRKSVVSRFPPAPLIASSLHQCNCHECLTFKQRNATEFS
jgi:hypothetical protein